MTYGSLFDERYNLKDLALTTGTQMQGKLVDRLRRFSVCLILITAIGTLIGCGGSGNGGGQQTQSTPDFALSLSSSNLSLTAGAIGTTTASVTGMDGFTSAVTLQLSGLPADIVFSPSSLQLAPGSSLQINFSAEAAAASSSAHVTVTGTSGSLHHSVALNLKVTAASGNTSLSRTKYRRTDAVTEYFLELNQNWMVFDPGTKRFFVSDPNSNRIIALDSVMETEIASIPVPGAFGIDETPDHSTIYAGTNIGDVYTIDPVTMQVRHRYRAAQIGAGGFYAYSVRVLSNGELALLGGQESIPSVYGDGSLAVWNPSSNAITVYGGVSSPFCEGNRIGSLTLTGDRSTIIAGSFDSIPTLCTLNPVTGQQKTLTNVLGYTNHIAPTPDGRSLLMPWNGAVAVYDAQTLAQTATISVNGDTSSAVSMIVSPDSKTLYIGDGQGILYAYDIASGSQIGWLPNLTVEPISGGSDVGPPTNPNLQAFDNTGLLAGPMEEGVGFLDTTALRTGSAGSEFLNDYLVPATGPAAGGTQTQWENLSQTGKLATAYLGVNPVTSLSQSSTEFYGTTPAGNPGPADLYALMGDGGMLIVPEGFSYGPTILEVTPGAATGEGGGTGIVYGYGFGPATYNSPIPSDLQITVGGKSVTVTGYAANAYGTSSPPFQLQAASFTIPPGSAGTSANVAVTTQAGTATAPGALQYLPVVQQYSLSGAALAQGVYDAKRDLYYFTDAAEIRVFSKTQGQWLTPFLVPVAPNGTIHRLWGIALSPDGSKLAVSDASAGMIYLINPDSPSTAQSFPFNVPYFAGSPDPSVTGVITNPAGLTISDTGMIYFAAFMYGGDGYDAFFKLDSNSGNVTDYKVVGFGGPLYKAAITADNSTVFFNNDGSVFSIDTATDTASYAPDGPGCCYGDYDLTLSSGQSTLEATGFLYDTNLNASSYLTVNDREVLNIAYVYGAKLSPDGTLLFQPSTNGIDVYDGRLGILRSRISLPVSLSQNFDALVGDSRDNVLIAITGQTGSGIAVVDLSSLNEPAPLPYINTQNTLKRTSLLGSPQLNFQPRNHLSPVASNRRRTARAVIQHVTNSHSLK